MRMASENEWIKLSEWQKIEINNDTLYFETIGEWGQNSKAIIEYIERDKLKLKFQKNIDDTEFKTIRNLQRIKDNFDINGSKEFWAKFKTREDIADCKNPILL